MPLIEAGMTEPELAICVVSYRRAALTARCIESIRRHTKLPYVVHLVDNGSGDTGTKILLDKLERCDDIRLYRLPENAGPSAGRNAALSALGPGADLVAFLDNDIVALPGWDLAAARAVASGIDLIQPLLLLADGATVERGPNHDRGEAGIAANPYYPHRGKSAADPDVNRAEEAAIVGTAAIASRAAVDRIGLFDERLHVGEDFDYSFRARRLGYRLGYFPECRLIHDNGFDIGYHEERNSTEKNLVSHIVFWRKWERALLSPAYLAWYRWLYEYGEPMYLPHGGGWGRLPRRLRRRLVRDRIMKRYPASWRTVAEAARATDDLAAAMGMT